MWQPSLGKMVAMILKRASETKSGCHIQNSLNLLTLRSPYVLPVPRRNGMSDDNGHVHHGILDTDALVGSTPENKVVPGVGLSRTIRIQPAARVELVGVAVDLGIPERVVEGGNNHTVGGDGVIIRDRESTGGLVGNL